MPQKNSPPGHEWEERAAPPQGQEKKAAPQTTPQQHQTPTPQPQQHSTPTPAPHHDSATPPAPPPHYEERPHVHQEERPHATLEFLQGWEQRQHGEIKAGGRLSVKFDPARLPQCRQSSHGAQVWDIDVGMIFHPGGQRLDGSVMRKVRMPEGGMVIDLVPQPFEVAVPSDATHVEMWFRNYYTLGRGCETWDSRYCQNYWFTVARS